MNPYPPSTRIASIEQSIAVSDANTLAIAASLLARPIAVDAAGRRRA